MFHYQKQICASHHPQQNVKHPPPRSSYKRNQTDSGGMKQNYVFNNLQCKQQSVQLNTSDHRLPSSYTDFDPYLAKKQSPSSLHVGEFFQRKNPLRSTVSTTTTGGENAVLSLAVKNISFKYHENYNELQQSKHNCKYRSNINLRELQNHNMLQGTTTPNRFDASPSFHRQRKIPCFTPSTVSANVDYRSPMSSISSVDSTSNTSHKTNSTVLSLQTNPNSKSSSSSDGEHTKCGTPIKFIPTKPKRLGKSAITKTSVSENNTLVEPIFHYNDQNGNRPHISHQCIKNDLR